MPIIVNRYEQQERENQEKVRWIESILSRLGIPMEQWNIVGSNNMMAVLRKIREDLRAFDIEILDDSCSGIDVYFKGNILASWKKPFYVLKENKEVKDPHYRYYLEMHLNIEEHFE